MNLFLQDKQQLQKYKQLQDLVFGLQNILFWKIRAQLSCLVEQVQEEIWVCRTALWVARIVSTDIAIGGVTSWQWWTAVSRGDYKDGLVHVDDGASNGGGGADYCKNDGYVRDSKTLWALGNFSFFVKPGMVRVQIPGLDNSTATTDVMLTAYKDEVNKKMVIVAVNIGTSARTYKLNLSGGTLTNNKLTPYTTSDTKSLKKGTDVDAANLEIGARSVVTYIGTYK